MADGNANTQKQNRKRENILKAAIEAFAEHGFYNTKISDVADRAGVADGTIYLYFENKDDLLISVFEDRMDWLIGRVQTELASLEGAIVDQFEKLVHLHLQIAVERPRLAEFITVELRQSAKFVKEYENEQFYEYLRLLEDILERGQNQNLLRGDLDTKALSRTIFGALDEALLALTLSDSTREDVEARAKQISTMFIEGLRAR